MKTKTHRDVPFELLSPVEQATQRAITAWLREHGPTVAEFKARCRRLYGHEKPFRAVRPTDEPIPAKLFDGSDE